MSVNKIILVGRLGQDPELRQTNGGQPVCNFSIATDSVWKDKSGERQKRTEWHRVQVWGPQAEACEKYLAKGREVYIEGEIRSRKYDDKQGVEKTVVEVVARDVRFLGSKDTAGGSAEPAGKASKKSNGDDSWGNDEIAF